MVVENASLNVRAGEIVGIAGLMGAGRTELAMSVFGRSYAPGSLDGSRCTASRCRSGPWDDAISHGIAYAQRTRKRYGLNLIEDIQRNISAARLGKISRFGIVDAATEIKRAETLRKDMRVKAENIDIPLESFPEVTAEGRSQYSGCSPN